VIRALRRLATMGEQFFGTQDPVGHRPRGDGNPSVGELWDDLSRRKVTILSARRDPYDLCAFFLRQGVLRPSTRAGTLILGAILFLSSLKGCYRDSEHSAGGHAASSNFDGLTYESYRRRAHFSAHFLSSLSRQIS
jgi:hypothetical protein